LILALADTLLDVASSLRDRLINEMFKPIEEALKGAWLNMYVTAVAN